MYKQQILTSSFYKGILNELNFWYGPLIRVYTSTCIYEYRGLQNWNYGFYFLSVCKLQKCNDKTDHKIITSVLHTWTKIKKFEFNYFFPVCFLDWIEMFYGYSVQIQM